MLKARKGKKLVFGLSEENITRLQKGQPIKFNLNVLVPGQDYEIYIIAGKTNESMMLMMKQMSEIQN